MCQKLGRTKNENEGVIRILLLADFITPPVREKKRRKTEFSLYEAVHECEYRNVPRPIDIRTNETIEPAHKFEVTLEPDDFTDEKCEIPFN